MDASLSMPVTLVLANAISSSRVIFARSLAFLNALVPCSREPGGLGASSRSL